MSRTSRFFAIAVIAIFAASVGTAADRATPKPSESNRWSVWEQNYIRALASPNEGVRVSAAGYLGRYQMTGGIDALINTLKTDKVEAVRSAAAFALILMDVPEGVKAVEDASLYDGSDKVATFCARLLQMQNVQSYTTLDGQ